MNRLNVLFIGFLSVFSMSCLKATQETAVAHPEPTFTKTPDTKSNQVQPGTIRAVDFRNFTYPWYPDWSARPAGVSKIQLVEGKMEIKGISMRVSAVRIFVFVGVVYGDVTNDGQEEAVVVLGISPGGSGSSFAIFVFSMVAGQPTMLWVLETGNKADDGFRNTFVADGLLHIDLYNRKTWPNKSGNDEEDAGHCCPQQYTRTSYQWETEQFLIVERLYLPNEGKQPDVVFQSQ